MTEPLSGDNLIAHDREMYDLAVCACNDCQMTWYADEMFAARLNDRELPHVRDIGPLL